MIRSSTDHSVFYSHSSCALCVYLIVNVNDIIITGNDYEKIVQLKRYMLSQFHTKDLGNLIYFLRIKLLSHRLISTFLK